MPQTTTRTESMRFPFSLGKVFPGADFATLSAPLTQNIIPTKIDHNGNEVQDNDFNSIVVQASLDNTGNIYVCNSADAPDLTNYTNVIAGGILTKGQVWTRGKEWANNRSLNAIYLGADNGTDFAIASIDQF